MEKRVNVKVDVELWRKVKSIAALKGETVNDFVSDALEQKIQSVKKGG